MITIHRAVYPGLLQPFPGVGKPALRDSKPKPLALEPRTLICVSVVRDQPQHLILRS